VSPGFLTESADESYERMKERVLDELKRAFRPEFINRIDELIVFHPLSEAHIKGIIRLMIDRVNKQLEEKAIRIELTPDAEELLLRKGYDATYGARQLRRTIQKHIEDPLAEAIVGAQIHEGARIEVRPNGEAFVFVPLAEPSLNLAER
jgi:ATP-dependent Clp protease ATP-binding subunit ClpC